LSVCVVRCIDGLLDFSIVNAALPQLTTDLGLATTTAKCVVTAYGPTSGGNLSSPTSMRCACRARGRRTSDRNRCLPAPLWTKRTGACTRWSSRRTGRRASRTTASAASRARIAADTARYRIQRDLHDGRPTRARDPRTVVAGRAGSRSAGRRRPRERTGTACRRPLRRARRAPCDRAQHSPDGARQRRSRHRHHRFGPPLHRATHLDVRINARLPEQIELSAYYVVAEALTKAAKHAVADTIDVQVVADAGAVRVCVRDDGRGSARLPPIRARRPQGSRRDARRPHLAPQPTRDRHDSDDQTALAE
jgi:hypothetical protein